MELKSYSSYAQIDRELEILKLEKEIQYQKVLVTLDKTKKEITPQNIVNNFIESYVEKATLPYGKILKSVMPFALEKTIPLIIKWLIRK
jgi:hypothetical protein